MNIKIDSPKTLRELCLDKLRTSIITGYFPSGTRLTERQLGEELGVSRTVVREVIRHLESEGLVEIIPNKGPVVASLNWEQASQIYQIRLLLEQDAVAACSERLTAKSAKAILTLLNALKNNFDKNDIGAAVQTTSLLYQTIFDTAGHHIAWEVVERLNGRISKLRTMTLNSPNRQHTGYERIERICHAICLDKDSNKAKEAVAEHLKEVQLIAKNLLTA